MTIKSTNELLAQADATLPDNNTQLITPAAIRAMIKDFIDTVSPAYGGINITSSLYAVTAAPAKLSPWTAITTQTAGYYAASAALGEVTRAIASASLAGATDFITIGGGVQGANNANLTLELYKDGLATGLKASVTCTGPTETVGFNIAGLQYKGGADAVYDLRANGPAGNYTLVNVAMIMQAQPVRSFV